MVEGYPCSAVVLNTDNGSLEKNSCYYSLHSAKFGLAKIQVSIKKGNRLKKIEELTVAVDSFPPPWAYVGGQRGGNIRKGAMAAQYGVIAGTDPILGFELHVKVAGFTIIILRKDSVIFCRSANNNLFDADTKEKLKTLQKDDLVLFTKIICMMADGIPHPAKPLEFCIIE